MFEYLDPICIVSGTAHNGEHFADILVELRSHNSHAVQCITT